MPRRDHRAARLRARVLAVLTAGILAAPAIAAAQPPGAPGAPSTWTTGAKEGVGTSTTGASKVWYTLAGGALTEVYYPRVDVAAVRDLQFVVSDGRTFAERETEATTHRVVLADRRALVYRQVSTARSGRYRITKTYVTDPLRSTLLVRVRFETLRGGRLALYALYDPALANTGSGDTGRSLGGGLVAHEGDAASALLASTGFARRSSGYAGTSDGWTDLRTDFDLDWSYDAATAGNVVQVGQVATGRRPDATFTLALGFGATPQAALETARASLRSSFASKRRAYARGWHRYLDALGAAPASVGTGALRTQYDVALMTLRAHEDKTYPGANIASLTVPWGEAVNADNPGVGGYHLVWARDLYQVATAQLAAGDRAAALRSLDYLFEVQQKPDGSFPQNSYLDGRPYWGSLQLDEVAFPIVLAWQLGRTDGETWREHVKPAADFIVGRGPATPQERWEEEGGYSPSTIAAEVAGLVTAAEIAALNGADASAALYRGVADLWQRSVEGWTFTTTGPLGDGRYYERIDGNGNPNDGERVEINNGGGTWDEREIVDAGFLELVRLGVKPPDDPAVAASLPEVDATIRVDSPNGPLWYRYNHDGYGEKADGSPYTGAGVGRLWPLLTGERGEYELANGRPALEHLRTMARTANAGFMIPEQVWDRPERTAYGFRFGEGTGSATPLAWSMAQFVRLAHSIDAGGPVERPAAVAARYATGPRPAGPALAVSAPVGGTTTPEATITVAGTTDAATVYLAAGGDAQAAAVTDGRFEAAVPLRLGANQLTVVAVGANGGTSTTQLTVTSTNLGRRIGGIADPAGDDHGPGTYVYPTNDAFNPRAFDLTAFEVYDGGDEYRFVATVAGELRNPWGGNGISVQRLHVYVQTAANGAPVPALPGTNARVAGAYQYVVNAAGFDDLGVRDATGAELAAASLLPIPATRQIVVSVPKSAFGEADLASARYAVAMLSHAGTGEGVGSIRPVYDPAYWQSPPPGQEWIREYRFGGGAGVFDEARPSRDTDTRDPNVLDIVVAPGESQAAALAWADAPATLPLVPLLP